MAPVNQNILIVHEMPRIRRLLRLQFERKGFDVLTASTESEFRSKVFFSHPQMIIMGLKLGNKRASDIHDWLLALGLNPDIPVVFMSGEQEKRLLRPLKRGRKKAVYTKALPSRVVVNDIENFLKY